jgi:hypothetical protein
MSLQNTKLFSLVKNGSKSFSLLQWNVIFIPGWSTLFSFSLKASNSEESLERFLSPWSDHSIHSGQNIHYVKLFGNHCHTAPTFFTLCDGRRARHPLRAVVVHGKVEWVQDLSAEQISWLKVVFIIGKEVDE